MANQSFGEMVEDFSPGLKTKRDPSRIEPGAAQSGQNTTITDGDLIQPVRGWALFGSGDDSGNPITSAKTFRLSTGLEIPIRASGEVLEYYHEGTEAWENLNDGYTDGARFDFAHFYDSQNLVDHIYFGNDFEPYSRWNGTYTQLDGSLGGGESEIQVNSVLKEKIHYSATASSSTTTTIDISESDWGTDIWNDIYYVRITSGAQEGKISKITDTTSTQITFDAISGLSGTPDFEIRQIDFSASGTIRIGTTDVSYTSLDNDNTFNGCTNTPAASDNSGVAQAITEYPDNPRGNIMISQNEKMFVMSDSRAEIHVSAQSDATDFTFSAPRVAGEGDLGIIPDGGGPGQGLGTLEDSVIILKRNILKRLTYSTDGDDLAQLDTLIEATGVGTESPKSVFKVDNQLFYASPEGGVKSVGRVKDKDFSQALQIADPIRRTVGRADFSEAAGVFKDAKAYISVKESEDSTFNDLILPFNYQKGAWETPIVGLNASDFFIYDNTLYACSAINNEVYEMEQETATVSDGTTEYPLRASWTSGNINFGTPANRNSFNMLYVEGYIADNTILNVYINYEYNGNYRRLAGTIRGDDDAILINGDVSGPLALDPLATQPLGADREVGEELNRFRTYLTVIDIPFYEVSITFESEGIAQEWKVLRYGFNAMEVRQIDSGLKKSLN